MMTPESILLVEDIYKASSAGEVDPDAVAAIYEHYDSEILRNVDDPAVGQMQ